MALWIETPMGWVNIDHVSEAWVEPGDPEYDDEGTYETWRVRVNLPGSQEVITVQAGFLSEHEAKEFLAAKLFGLQPIA